ncbi:MAG: hypothetical protein LC118_14300 [Dehalococcoidia bacterium]|nr:hypothetical protein [Dehalococcoidia bacterium]
MLTIATVWNTRQPESFDIAIDSLAIVRALGWGDIPFMGPTLGGIRGSVNNLFGTPDRRQSIADILDLGPSIGQPTD